MDRRRSRPADRVRAGHLYAVPRPDGGVIVRPAPPTAPTRPSPSVPLQGRPAPPQSPLDTAGTAERGWAGTVRAAWGRAARALRGCWIEWAGVPRDRRSWWVGLAAVGLWVTLWATRGCAP